MKAKELTKIENAYYMGPPIAQLEKFPAQPKVPLKQTIKEAFNHIHDFMLHVEKFPAQPKVPLKQTIKEAFNHIHDFMLHVEKFPAQPKVPLKQTIKEAFNHIHDFMLHVEKFPAQPKVPLKQTIKEAFNHIHDFMLHARVDVEAILAKRLQDGEIKDIAQTRKSIAGNMFAVPDYLHFYQK